MDKEEEEVPYVPPSEDQLKWIEAHKQEGLSPEEAREFHNEEVPEGMTPAAYITQQIEDAKAKGGIIFDAVKQMDVMQWGDVGEPHDCTCLKCRSIWLPKERQGPGHFGTRFGMEAILHVFKGQYDKPDAIFLADVIEVDCDEGWALRVRQPIHVCRNCWQGVCVWKDRGEFSVIGLEPGGPEDEARAREVSEELKRS
jgi:hypothetical protein